MGRAARFRYYFKHPYSRLTVCYSVILFNFLLFAEDPISHSQTETDIIVVGNCFSFLFNKYPGPLWSFIKVTCWMLAIITGMFAGKFIFHRKIFRQYLRLKMFRDDHGSWMTMFFSTILFLFIYSHVYNVLLQVAGKMDAYLVTEYMGIRNETFMKMAAVGTWIGDFVTAWMVRLQLLCVPDTSREPSRLTMTFLRSCPLVAHLHNALMVTDMMLQDGLYPDWAKAIRAFWKRGYNRIVLFWLVLVSLTTAVVLIIVLDWISWDSLNRGLMPSNEVSRAFLASFILVFDLLIVMQDWEFPHFMGGVDINLPGLPTNHITVQLPDCIFKEEYHIHITGRWFNYGVIFLVLIFDLNMWKNQIFYQPFQYGQYVGPEGKIYTVKDADVLEKFNRTTLTYEWRSANINPDTNRTYAAQDMFLQSRFYGASLAVKCLAFIPSLGTFLIFMSCIWFSGRFRGSETLRQVESKTYERIKKNSPSDYSKELGVSPETHMTLREVLRQSEMQGLPSADGPHGGGRPPADAARETPRPPKEPADPFDVRQRSP